MRVKIGALVAAAIAVVVMLPGTAFAAHHIGGYYWGCVGPGGTNYYDKVYIAVDGVGSDKPKNAVAAARAHVEETTSCHVGSSTAYVRAINIDKLVLAGEHGAVWAVRTNIHANGNNLQADTAGRAVPCGVWVRPQVRWSLRYSNGAVVHGFYWNGTFSAAADRAAATVHSGP